jgi:hypothetical protein
MELPLHQPLQIQAKQDVVTVPKPIEIPRRITRLTSEEFLQLGRAVGSKDGRAGKVPGSYFPKSRLPLIDGKDVRLRDVAAHLKVPIISFEGRTDIFLDFGGIV